VVFNSLTFVVFFAVVLGLHALPFPWRVKKLNLLVASYLFYAAWNPPFVLLLWLSTLVDWYAARGIARSDSAAGRRALLGASLAANLGVLGFFKYGDFLLDGFRGLVGPLGVIWVPPELDVFLPIGISFYTFQSLSYTFDVYRGRTQPWTSFLDFALFVTFFPQLVAGPIVRATWFLPQCVEPRRANGAQLGWGFTLLTIGLFEKTVLADGVMAPVVDTVYGSVHEAGFVDGWIGTIAFAGQIFFDFAGYSTCAIGAALCLGFVLPDNFRFPYAAVGFSDFWRRWHVSLSTWLRDYLYVPLGGNRRGPGRTYVNLMLTMLLGGLWHGAAWRFVAWGGLHGAYLAVERVLRARFADARWTGRAPARIGFAALTYALVNVAWVFFRAETFEDAFVLLRAMLLGAPDELWLGMEKPLLVLFVTALLLAGQWGLRDGSIETLWRRMPWWLRSFALAGMVLSIVLVPGDNRAFIYFQF
jgi:D-alanyl-lipoteichoic acid acyltransferase DltB (MBOAT superfamily)